MKRVLALASVAIVVAVSLAFTMPTKKQVATSNAVSSKMAIDKQPIGGIAIDKKD